MNFLKTIVDQNVKVVLRSPTVEQHEIHQNEYQTDLIIVKQQTNSIMFDEVK